MKARPKFLILDDNEDNRYLECHSLLKEFPDCRIVECSNVPAALAAARSGDFDGIVTDHHLGESDGAEFVHHLRSAGIFCPVVMVTGSSDPQVIDRALRSGANRVFSGSDADFVGYFRDVVDSACAKCTAVEMLSQNSPPPSGSSVIAKILIIDDNDMLRSTIRAALRWQGHHVREAHDGREGIQLCELEVPDLVITDLIMPNQEGLDTLEVLRKKYPRVKVIAMSGGGSNPAGAYLRLAQKLGAKATLAKPFSHDELNAAVACALAS